MKPTVIKGVVPMVPASGPVRVFVHGYGAALNAKTLIDKGRRVLFALNISPDGSISIEALDADPWAVGWQMYGRKLAFERNPWMKLVLAQVMTFPLLMWMLKKAKP